MALGVSLHVFCIDARGGGTVIGGATIIFDGGGPRPDANGLHNRLQNENAEDQ